MPVILTSCMNSKIIVLKIIQPTFQISPCLIFFSANQNALLCRTQLMIEEEERIGQLEQREQSMRQLESDIVDVNTIFKVK